MASVNLGSIKSAPRYVAGEDVVIMWDDSSVRKKLPLMYNFSNSKTYLAFIRSLSKTIQVEGNPVNIEIQNIGTSVFSKNDFLMTFFATMNLNEAVRSAVTTVPFDIGSGVGIVVAKPAETVVASFYRVVILEL